MDIAKLTIAVESKEAQRAKQNLDQLGESSKRVETGTDKLSRAARSLDGTMGALRRSISQVTRVMGPLVAAFAAYKLVRWGTQTAELIDQQAKFADRLGISQEALGGLEHAAGLTGVQVSQLHMGLQRMTRRVSEAAMGTGEARDAIRELGIDAGHLTTLTIDQQFRGIAQAMSEVDSEADKVRLSFKLFDSEGVALKNTLALGAAGLDDVQARAEQLGIAISRVDARRVEMANEAILEMKGAFQGLANTAVIELAPSVQLITEAFTDWLADGSNARQLVQDLAGGARELTLTLVEVAAAVAGTFDSISKAVLYFEQKRAEWRMIGAQIRGDDQANARYGAQRGAAIAALRAFQETDTSAWRKQVEDAFDRIDRLASEAGGPADHAGRSAGDAFLEGFRRGLGPESSGLSKMLEDLEAELAGVGLSASEQRRLRAIEERDLALHAIRGKFNQAANQISADDPFAAMGQLDALAADASHAMEGVNSRFDRFLELMAMKAEAEAVADLKANAKAAVGRLDDMIAATERELQLLDEVGASADVLDAQALAAQGVAQGIEGANAKLERYLRLKGELASKRAGREFDATLDDMREQVELIGKTERQVAIIEATRQLTQAYGDDQEAVNAKLREYVGLWDQLNASEAPRELARHLQEARALSNDLARSFTGAFEAFVFGEASAEEAAVRFAQEMQRILFDRLVAQPLIELLTNQLTGFLGSTGLFQTGAAAAGATFTASAQVASVNFQTGVAAAGAQLVASAQAAASIMAAGAGGGGGPLGIVGSALGSFTDVAGPALGPLPLPGPSVGGGGVSALPGIGGGCGPGG